MAVVGPVERAARYLPVAPVRRAVLAPRSGWVHGVATPRDIGLLVIELGGGRRQADDAIDHRVGLSELVGLGARVEAGDRLVVVHAAAEAGAEMAGERLETLFDVVDQPPAAVGVVATRLVD